MTDAITARIADKYIARDGSTPKPSRHSLSVEQESVALDALRKIARGQDGRRPLKGDCAQRIARSALNGVMQPNWS